MTRPSDTGLPMIEAGSPTLISGIDESVTGAIQFHRPALDTLPYADLVRALLKARGFRFAFNRQAPEAALSALVTKICGVGAYAAQQQLFAAEIAGLAGWMGSLADGPPTIALRSYFAPGDLVWHVDRLGGTRAYRLVWPIGRPAGMQVTGQDNIDDSIYAPFMAREYPLLGRLDTAVMRTGVAVEQYWAHRPAQLAAMQKGDFPFVRDSSRILSVMPGAASVHRVETAARRGTFHRSSWANRSRPGLQLVITVADG